MVPTMVFLFRLLLAALSLSLASSLSAISDNANMAKSRLMESLKSLSGKLTLSPEVSIEDPTDPTALLLQSTAVQALSTRLRVAKANAAFLKGSDTSIQTFLAEQESARGSFPGPLPVIVCGETEGDLSELDGACGILITTSNVEDEAFAQKCQAALGAGIQPVPEIVLNGESDDETILKLVESIKLILGGQDPAGMLITMTTSEDDDNDNESEIPPLPTVPKALAKQVPILGSVTTMAGGNRMGSAVQDYKALGYTGAVLRAGCLPPGLELEVTGRFWGNCLGDLKSVKSKNFEFRTKNYLEKSTPVEWAKYQKSVIDSGALGSAEDNVSINADNGDYQGF